MQAKISDNALFLQRAKELQAKLGFITDEQLAVVIGISPKTYYTAIKDGLITAKTWKKLEMAERRASVERENGQKPQCLPLFAREHGKAQDARESRPAYVTSENGRDREMQQEYDEIVLLLDRLQRMIRDFERWLRK